MTEYNPHSTTTLGILVAMTATTGLVDAVSFLALGHIFTANMTGNVVFLAFAFAGTPGVSIGRSFLALLCFLVGAVLGGRLMRGSKPARHAQQALWIEAALLLVATATSSGVRSADHTHLLRQSTIVCTAVAMGIRNAFVRKLAVPDLTTTVLTLTITGLAAESTLAGGQNPLWVRRSAAILAMFAGATLGTLLLRHSVALPLGVGCSIIVGCALAARHAESPARAE
ncbi:MAG: DUF1275 domain-containing protein [Acidobacteriaceae bacterium]|nr:DUF1275 domain-containing protein [Acidobacteriaceae bacterium]MBV9306525.1 DUF1275 domain-containing protein [Acidobacteriaceae bacterium]